MRQGTLLLLVTLGVALCVARVQPPVSISLTTKWRSTSLSCEVLEFVATESPNKYWPFLRGLLKDPATGENDYFPKQTVEEILTPSETQQLKMAMDLRLFSPRVAMHYQVAEQEWGAANARNSGCGEEKKGTWVLHAPSLTPFCSLEEVKGLVRQKEACTPAEGAIHLPEDLERFSDEEGEREWVLYSDLEEAAPFITYFEKSQIPFIFRYNQKNIDSSSSEWEPATMQGYGVRIDLKKMEYKAVDDSSSPDSEANEDAEEDAEGMEDEDSEMHGFYFGRLLERKPELSSQLTLFRENLKSLDISPDESVEYYKSVKPWDLKQLPLRAAQRILKSSDPLATLLDVTQNLPSYAKALSKVKVNAHIKDTLEEMEIGHLPSGNNGLVINGNFLPAESLTPLSLYQAISTEFRRGELLGKFGFPDSLLASAMEGEKMSPKLESARFDIRSKAVTWIHRLDGPEYGGRVPSSLRAVLSIPEGQVGFHGKHPATMILGGDPSTDSFRDVLTDLFYRIRQGFSLRVGLVMASNTDVGKALINSFHFFSQQYNEFQALQALITLGKYTDLEQLEETLAQNHLSPAMLAQMASSNPKLKKKTRQTAKFLGLIGVDLKKGPWEATMFVNGIPILANEDPITEALEVAARDISLIKTLIESGKIHEKTSGGENLFYHYLLSRDGVSSHVPPFLWERAPAPEIFRGFSGGPFFGDLAFLSSPAQEKVKMLSYVLFADYGTTEGLVLMRDVLDATSVCALSRAGETSKTSHGCADVEGAAPTQVLALSSSSQSTTSELVVRAIQSVARTESQSDALKFARLLMSNLLELSPKKLSQEEEVLGALRKSASDALGHTESFLHLERGSFMEKEEQLREAFGFEDSTSTFGLYTSVGSSHKIEKNEGFPRSSLLLLHQISADSASSLYEQFLQDHDYESEKMTNDFFLLKSFLIQNGHESFDLSGVKSVSLPPMESSVPPSRFEKTCTLTAILDPISSEAHKIAKMMMWIGYYYPGMNMEIVLNPRKNLQELPTKSFYQYVLSPDSIENGVKGAANFFDVLPQTSLLTVEMEADPSWLVLPVLSVNDLDNLKLEDIKEKQVMAQYEVASLLYQGQCFEGDFQPPQGLQLYLGDSANEHLVDTTVMLRYGYFQLQALPGVWWLSLAEGKAREAYTIMDGETGMDKQMVVVSDYVSEMGKLNVRKRPGMEQVSLLSTEEDVDFDDPSYLSSFYDYYSGNKNEVTKSSEDDTIHVFSLASGHLYERFLKIMALSVLKHTNNPVKFWFVANFLSPQFKTALPEMAKTYNFEFEFVTYQWPWWLHEQTEKQRRIWGYKILFLDVLFPLSVQKIIYVDADQIVRADLKELVDMDLEGAVYGFTPMCNDRVEMEGFRFWRQGYWKDHLRERPYHISALYVVDLARFRNMAAGDRLRATYDGLSQDKNSLANLDQDLPNYMQHQLKIFSLPQEWLWCETWCSDESKSAAKTIDLCNNPLTKTPKLDNAVRIVEEWTSLDEEARSFS